MKGLENMIRGVSFKIPQTVSDTLWQILQCCNTDIYNWQVIKSQEEVWSESGEEDFFSEDYYKGYDFTKHIHSNHYIIFLKLQAYLNQDEYENINTYDEFLKSNCQLLLLVYDCEFVEIYIKNQSCAGNVFQNAIDKNFENVAYITENNDYRTGMNIL